MSAPGAGSRIGPQTAAHRLESGPSASTLQISCRRAGCASSHARPVSAEIGARGGRRAVSRSAVCHLHHRAARGPMCAPSDILSEHRQLSILGTPVTQDYFTTPVTRDANFFGTDEPFDSGDLTAAKTPGRVPTTGTSLDAALACLPRHRRPDMINRITSVFTTPPRRSTRSHRDKTRRSVSAR